MAFYKGFFCYDQFQGEGILSVKDGEYTGSFVKGMMEGFGVFRWQDGSIYEGSYLANKKNGMGKYISLKGEVYEGMWLNGQRHGEGCIKRKNDEEIKGTWKYDILLK